MTMIIIRHPNLPFDFFQATPMCEHWYWFSTEWSNAKARRCAERIAQFAPHWERQEWTVEEFRRRTHHEPLPAPRYAQDRLPDSYAGIRVHEDRIEGVWSPDRNRIRSLLGGVCHRKWQVTPWSYRALPVKVKYFVLLHHGQIVGFSPGGRTMYELSGACFRAMHQFRNVAGVAGALADRDYLGGLAAMESLGVRLVFGNHVIRSTQCPPTAGLPSVSQ